MLSMEGGKIHEIGVSAPDRARMTGYNTLTPVRQTWRTMGRSPAM